MDLRHFGTDPNPRIRTSDLGYGSDPDPAPDPALFVTVVTFKIPTEKFFLLIIFDGTVHLHYASKIKSHKVKKSPNSRNQGFSYCICLMMEGSGSGKAKNTAYFGHSSISTADFVVSEEPSTCTTAVETEHEEEIKEEEIAQPEGEGTAAVSCGSPAKTIGGTTSIKGQTSGVNSIFLLDILCVVAEFSREAFWFCPNLFEIMIFIPYYNQR